MLDEPLADWEKSIRAILFLMGSVFVATAASQLADAKFVKAICFFVGAAVFLAAWSFWEKIKKSLLSRQWVGFKFAAVVSIGPAIALIIWQFYTPIADKAPSIMPTATVSGGQNANSSDDRVDGTREIPPSPKTPPSTPTRDITSVTTEFLRSLVKDKYGSEAEESTSPFIGKWMRVSGAVFGQIEYHKNLGFKTITRIISASYRSPTLVANML